ncbi:MAG: NAD(P)-dependent oxidoreductase [Sphingomonadaceae bacterium]|nr:siroheme synthase [Sphingomonadaceae bacterium]
MQSLPLFHRIKGQPVLVLGDGDAAEAKARLVERAGGKIIRDMQEAIDTGVRLAFVAYEDAKAAEVAAINLRCAGLLVNVVDRPDLCDFTTPSILDRDPVLVAVGTGGASAGLAKHVRLRLEAALPQTLGALASKLFAKRDALRARYPDGADRRRALDNALKEGGALDVLDAGSAERVESWLETPEVGTETQTHAITLTSDDPDDLTLRQARLLGMADVVVHDADVPETILCRARADAVRVVSSASSANLSGLTVILRRK